MVRAVVSSHDYITSIIIVKYQERCTCIINACVQSFYECISVSVIDDFFFLMNVVRIGRVFSSSTNEEVDVRTMLIRSRNEWQKSISRRDFDLLNGVLV